MFESDIERSKIRLLELVNSTQPTVYLNDILGRASIDYAYKQYFEAEFGWWLYEEQTLRQANPNLDLNDPATVGILNNLDTQYRKHARFDREQLMLIIDSAVKCVLNYRVRPRTTLKWFVFRGEPTKPIYEVYLRMRYFADYRYLHEGFNQWLLKRGLRYDSLDIISVLEFERLIKKIDDDTILELSPSQFVELISPISYFFAELSADPTKQSIPIEAVIIFLDDKEVYIIAQKLERMLYQQGIQQLTKEMFLSVVDEVLSEIEAEQSGEGHGEPHANSASEASTEFPIDPAAPRLRPSASDVLRPTGTAASESVITAGLGAVPQQAGAAGASRINNPSNDSGSSDAASSVSVIEALSRRGESAGEQVDAPHDHVSEDETPATQTPTNDSSLFVKQASHDASSGNNAGSAFVMKNEDEIANSGQTTQSQHDEHAALDLSTLREELSSQISSDVQTRTTAHSTDISVEASHHEPVFTHEPLTVSSIEAQPSVEATSTFEPTPTAEVITETQVVEAAEPVQSAAAIDAVEEAKQSILANSATNSIVIDSTSPPTLGIISRALGNEPVDQTDLAPRSPYFENVVRVHTPDEHVAPEAKVYPSITSFYDERQRDNYIKRLCAKDAQRFGELVASIDQTRNWKEALSFLDKFYSQESIDPQSSVARDFRMAVYKRFIAL